MSNAPPIKDAEGAAAAFEAYFLRRVLAEVQTGEGLTGGGFAGGMFKEMLDEAIADAMSKAGGVGLADAVSKQISDADTGVERHDDAAAPSGPTLPAPSAGALRSPLEGATTSSFGERKDPIEGDIRHHAGLDLAAPEGTPVHAAAPGVIKHAGPAGTYGNLVIVDHGNGLETRYAHLEAVDVVQGARVPAGTQVGRVGQTGRATGPHLHFEVRKDGQALDPTDEISGLKFRGGWSKH